MSASALTLTLAESLVPEKLVADLLADQAASRLFAKDDTLWGAQAQPEASIRLGWVDPEETYLPESARTLEDLLRQIESVRAELSAAGIDRIVLSGMGGSSLAPEVITRRYSVPLVVLDSTHPSRVRRAIGDDLSRTALVVSSKSGSTVETQSHRDTFEAAFREAGIDPASRIIVVTDPGSPFEESARERGNRVFLADPTVGGRYSALTAFGLVPSGLAGADVRELVREAGSCRDELATDSAENPAIRLAAAIYAGLPERFTLVLAAGTDHPSNDSAAPSTHADAARTDWGLPDWIEQLIAESTGKHGHGVLPLSVRQDAPEMGRAPLKNALRLRVSPLPAHASGDRLAGPLGAQFLCWGATTALLGRLMGINPFDQPDVESAKIATREFLEEGVDAAPALGTIQDVPGATLLRIADDPTAERMPSTAADLWQRVFGSLPTNGYLAIQAYLDSGSQVADELDALRAQLAELLGAPVSLGWGPRFLHSTGQLHKGGPAVGAFLQLTDEATPDLAIPGSPQTYRELLIAQAAGDAAVLESRGRPVTTVRFDEPLAGVRALRAALAHEASRPHTQAARR